MTDVVCTPMTIAQGGSTTVAGHGYNNDAPIDIYLDGKLLATTMTGNYGNFIDNHSRVINIPSNATVGGHTISATDGTHMGVAHITVTSSVSPPPPSPYSGIYVGVMTRGSNFSEFHQFESDAGKKAAIVAGGGNDFGSISNSFLQQAYNEGKAPLVRLMPSNSLSTIANGGADTAMKNMAQQLSALGFPIILSFCHEMNGSWYSWGQQPSLYVPAFRRFHDVVKAIAKNVLTYWCPNMEFTWVPDIDKIKQYYPGDNYVDLVGGDFYNKPIGSGGWASGHQLLDYHYNDTYTFSTKPFLIGEFGCAEVSDFINHNKSVPQGATKDKWITDTLNNVLPSLSHMFGFCWFNVNQDIGGDGSGNFAIESSAQSQSAFVNAVSGAVYKSTY